MVSASDNAVLYVVGGIGVHHSFHQQTQIPVERYDLAANQWTVLTSSTLAGRSIGHYLALDDSSIISVRCSHLFTYSFCFQCFESVGWAAGRASGL